MLPALAQADFTVLALEASNVAAVGF